VLRERAVETIAAQTGLSVGTFERARAGTPVSKTADVKLTTHAAANARVSSTGGRKPLRGGAAALGAYHDSVYATKPRPNARLSIPRQPASASA
jgi:hypothetical protein